MSILIVDGVVMSPGAPFSILAHAVNEAGYQPISVGARTMNWIHRSPLVVRIRTGSVPDSLQGHDQNAIPSASMTIDNPKFINPKNHEERLRRRIEAARWEPRSRTLAGNLSCRLRRDQAAVASLHDLRPGNIHLRTMNLNVYSESEF